MKKVNGLWLIVYSLMLLLFTIYYLPYTTFAAVDISKEFDFGDITNLGQGVTRLVAPAFSIAALAVVIYFLIGAFKWVQSGGDKEKIASARGMITHAIIGFVILMFAFLVFSFISQAFDLPFSIF